MLLLVCGCLSSAYADGYHVYYSAGFVNHVTMQGQFQLAVAEYSATGSLISNRNLTQLDCFMMVSTPLTLTLRLIVSYG